LLNFAALGTLRSFESENDTTQLDETSVLSGASLCYGLRLTAFIYGGGGGGVFTSLARLLARRGAMRAIDSDHPK